jgi:NitT/TauT family transport system substrate-binding protein
MISPHRGHRLVPALAIASLVLAGCAGDDAGGGGSSNTGNKLTIAVLAAPSLTSFYAPLNDANDFDGKHGLEISFVPKSPQGLRTEFASGSTQISAGATVLTDVALLNQQGAQNVYLFNTFDWWGTVVTPASSGIQSVRDLGGKRVLGALSTTNYAMFKMTAGAAGVDLGSLQEQNADTAGLVAAARSGREQAIQMWEPAHSSLTADNSDWRTLDLVGAWKQATGTQQVPYVGVAVSKEWAEQNPTLVQPLYETFADMAKYVKENPAEAAQQISAATKIDEEVLTGLLASDRLGFTVYPATEAKESLQVILDKAAQYGVLKSKPDLNSLLYSGQITASN